MNYYMLKLLGLRQETEDAVTVILKQLELKKLKQNAGLYLILIFGINGRRYNWPCAFSSVLGTDSDLNITVKRVSSGIVSNHIMDYLQVEVVLDIMEGTDEITFEDKGITNNSNIVFGYA
jgi:ring-1,2-phenylacetyl-CoA epoxidase subunit PaaE